MEAFAVKSFPSLLIIVLMTSSAVTEKLSVESENVMTAGVVADTKLSTENKNVKAAGAVADTKLSTANGNGNSSRTLGAKINTKDECNPRDVTGARRIVQYVFNNPNLQCYRKYFVGGQQPVGLRQPNDADIRYICQPPKPNQRLQQTYTYYATMFDEETGLAVFSAYKLIRATARFPTQAGNAKRPEWCPTPGIEVQGSDDLYKDQGYERGHLAPAQSFSINRQRYLSTFTYTNGVPMRQSFNGGWWRRAENRIRIYAQHYCTQGQQRGTLYLLTGTSFSRFEPNNFPQANQVQIEILRNRYNPDHFIMIPVSMWTAGCCVRGPNNPNTRGFAVIGNNLQNQVGGPDRSLTRQVPVAGLQTFLGNDAVRNHFIVGAPNVRLFPGDQNCLQDTNRDILNLAVPQQGGG